MTWSLLNNIERTLEAWGISNLTRNLVSQGQDTVLFEISNLACDAPLPIAEYTTCIIKRDGVPWFHGLVIGAVRSGGPYAERISYQLAGPWWYLENLVYQQKWYSVVDPTALTKSKVGGYKSHVLLNQGTNGASLTTGQQIADAVQFAIDSGAPIAPVATYNPDPVAIDLLMPAVKVPFSEDRDITCSEVIRKMLRWTPDAVTWFDYSVTPPAFRCRRRESLTPVTISIPNSALPNPSSALPIESISVRPRTDIQRPAVVLKFEQTNQVEGVGYANTTYRISPDNGLAPGSAEYLALAATHERTFGAFVATIELAGSILNYATATIVCEPVAHGSIAWWLNKDRTLETVEASPTTAKILTLELTNQNRTSALPNELVKGQLAPWMNKKSEDDTVTCQIKKTIKTENAEAPAIENTDLHSARIVATDAASGTYKSLQSAVLGEEIPEGLAAEFFKAINTLQYQGSVTTVEEEVSGAATIGNLLNLVGSAHTAWETMAAMVQQITEELDSGRTTIILGAPEQLGPADLVELTRVNRTRAIFTAPAEKISGESSAARNVVLGSHTPKENSTAGAQNPKRMIITGAGLGIIDIAAAAANLKTLYIREIAICVNNQPKHMMILASDPY